METLDREGPRKLESWRARIHLDSWPRLYRNLGLFQGIYPMSRTSCREAQVEDSLSIPAICMRLQLSSRGIATNRLIESPHLMPTWHASTWIKGTLASWGPSSLLLRCLTTRPTSDAASEYPNITSMPGSCEGCRDGPFATSEGAREATGALYTDGIIHADRSGVRLAMLP